MATLSIVIPCFNEGRTLTRCVEQVLRIAETQLSLQLIIVDDGSTDDSLAVARRLQVQHPEVSVVAHERNQGKGAALRTGFAHAAGDFVAVQDADLKYDPADLKRMADPLLRDEADVVLGSRFLSAGAHRVLFFWHSLGNRFLTLLSNMMTDLNLTDMECGYKMFRRDVLRRIELEESRFGFEPEVVAKLAQLRVRIFEMGVSYRGRTYAEGKKIGVKDGVQALYCILHYNASRAPVPVQFLLYLVIGGIAALVNIGIFLGLLAAGWVIIAAALSAFVAAAAVNYALCVVLLFRHKARWNSFGEMALFLAVVGVVGWIDAASTQALMSRGVSAVAAKCAATGLGLILNFLGRRYLIFPEPAAGPWKPQEPPG